VERFDDQLGEEFRDRGAELPAAPDQRSVNDAEQPYRWLMDHNPVAIGVHVNGRYVYVNETLVRKMAAQSASQFIGRHVTDFVHPNSLAAVQARVAARQHEQDTSTPHDGDTFPPMELLICAFDGTVREVEALAAWTRWEGKPAHQVIFRDLTVQRATETSLRFQAALVAHASDAIISTTLSGEVTSWNPAAEAIYGRSALKAMGLPIGEAVGAVLDPAAIIASGGVVHANHCSADGASRSVCVSVSRMDAGYVVLCADQTALRRAEQHFQTVVASLDEGVMVIAGDGEVQSVNPAALRILGLRATGVDGVELVKAVTVPVYDAKGRLLSSDQRPVLETLTTSPQRDQVYGVDRLGDGRRIWISANWSFLDPTDPHRSSVLVSFNDITEQHNAHQRLIHQATHDLVTGLPNRAYIVELVTEAIICDEPRLGAVLFIDMDKFKSINDALGHHAGDTVLQIAGQRLRRALRLNDIVGRVGGDEFVALLAAPIERAEVDGLVNQLHAALEKPIVVESENGCTITASIRISASIGIVTLRVDERRGAVEILRDADLAMYEAKSTGQATSRFREPTATNAAQ
jgi:diguanylate cyclase (GGDEF)-like protein/PAS domain S-box-containing protein